MEYTGWVLIVEWMIRIGFSVRVIMRRRPVGVSLAWIAVILAIPVAGTRSRSGSNRTGIGWRLIFRVLPKSGVAG